MSWCFINPDNEIPWFFGLYLGLVIGSLSDNVSYNIYTN